MTAMDMCWHNECFKCRVGLIVVFICLHDDKNNNSNYNNNNKIINILKIIRYVINHYVMKLSSVLIVNFTVNIIIKKKKIYFANTVRNLSINVMSLH